ncbi:MAG: UDP-3-O-(3-hydroxymyristoyl)glucosamine N-acyltransferase [Proteobacteria bacterium]|nr:UDP-3-O-(3-hydroxymyristoyl)glucosamine N-acyltransferase [Pseudomonadota bacterium]
MAPQSDLRFESREIQLSTSLGELAVQFGCELVGDPAARVSRVATLANADSESLSFFANKAYRDELRQTTAAAVLVHPDDASDCPVNALLADDPYLAYARIADVLYPFPDLAAGIHKSAVVASSARVPDSVQVSANVVVEDDCVIGDQVFIGPGVVIGPRCTIGAGTRLLANVTLVQDVQMGGRCIVHPGAVIGSDGFGNAMSDGGWVKVPQVGGVRIGNDVEIGANTTIDRGAIDDTVIENGVRLDNLIQIAHNVQIGEHTAMAAYTGISGSTIIGKRCMFAGRSGTVGHINICDDVVIGGLSMVSKDIREPGFYAASFAAEKAGNWKRKVARFRRLGALAKRVRALEKSAGSDDDR